MTGVGIGFVLLSILMVAIVLWAYVILLNRLSRSSTQIRNRLLIVLFLFSIYATYLFFLGDSGILMNMDFPPKLPLLLVIPLLVMLLFLTYRSGNREMIQQIPDHWLIFVQSFRIPVELLILGMYFESIVPKSATFEGYNYEILVGILAIVLGFFIRRGDISKKGIFLWNILGLLSLGIIIGIIVSSFYLPELWGADAPLVDERFTQIPYLLLTGFLAPLAIFFHLLSFRQQQLKKLAKSGGLS